MDVLGSPSLIVRTVSVNVKQQLKKTKTIRVQELCESRSGRPGFPVPNSQYGLNESKATFEEEKENTSELRSCVKVEVDVLGSPSLIVSTVSMKVKQHLKKKKKTLQSSEAV